MLAGVLRKGEEGRGVYCTGLRLVACTLRALDGVLVVPINPRVKLQHELF